MERAKISQIFDNVWLIDDAGDATCYVVTGKDKAMVIDTLNGVEDLHEIVRTLTDLPLVVVNTHGHGDHVAGNIFFDEAWLHPADEEMAHGFFEMIRTHYADEAKKVIGDKEIASCPIRHLSIGQVFDLGGVELEVVDLKGHTPGSVGFLERKNRVLFSGDGILTAPWMQLDHSLPVSTLRESLIAVKRDFGTEFDCILHGHAQGLVGAELVDKLLQGCEELLRGETEDDQPYTYFNGTCRLHPVKGEEGVGIVYEPSTLK